LQQKSRRADALRAAVFSLSIGITVHSLITAAQFLRRWFSALTQTGTRSGKRRKINFAACRRISSRRLRFSVHFMPLADTCHEAADYLCGFFSCPP